MIETDHRNPWNVFEICEWLNYTFLVVVVQGLPGEGEGVGELVVKKKEKEKRNSIVSTAFASNLSYLQPQNENDL